jgi:hypothetical protein
MTDDMNADGRVDRRRFLSAVGLSAATLAVGGASGLTVRAIGQDVLTPGRGGAYAAWRQRSGSEQDGLLALVRAAVLAANGHNTQPWLFVVERDRIDVFADATRGEGALDPLGRELHLSLGCALENLALAGYAYGRAAHMTLVPDPANPTHMAQVTLTSTARTTSPLYLAVPDRHTNRYPYDTNRHVATAELRDIARLNDDADLDVVWFTGRDEKARFGDLTIEATRAAIADPAVTAVDHAWFRHSRATIEDRKDGLTIDGAGLPDAVIAVAKLLPAISPSQQDEGFLSATRDRQVPTAAAFGMICGRLPTSPAQQLAAGRLWQRLHLHTTTRRLAVQPMNQAVERADREHATGLAPQFADALADLLPHDLTPLMPFRIGYSTHDGRPSPRRPAEEVTHYG